MEMLYEAKILEVKAGEDYPQRWLNARQLPSIFSTPSTDFLSNPAK
jgi:hypothetical protein